MLERGRTDRERKLTTVTRLKAELDSFQRQHIINMAGPRTVQVARTDQERERLRWKANQQKQLRRLDELMQDPKTSEELWMADPEYNARMALTSQAWQAYLTHEGEIQNLTSANKAKRPKKRIVLTKRVTQEKETPKGKRSPDSPQKVNNEKERELWHFTEANVRAKGVATIKTATEGSCGHRLEIVHNHDATGTNTGPRH